MKYTVDKQEKYSIFALNEDRLLSLIAPDLKSQFTLLHAEGVPNLILDLKNVTFVDSAGLSAILTAKRLWKDSSFVLTGVNESVKKLIDISKLTNQLMVIPTIDEAIELVHMEELERELSAD
jgi:anti-sigma B factor antagonist